MKKVFISYPYADDPVANKKRVDKVCKLLVERGDILPISPLHLFSFMENDNNRELVIEVCYRLIDICDEIWVYGDSDGCRKEREYATKKNKKVTIKYSGDKDGKTDKA